MVEFVDMDWFKEVVLHADGHALRERFVLGASGDDDDVDVRPAFADLVDEPDAAEAGHAQIGDDERCLFLLQKLERRLGGVGGLAVEMKRTSRPHQDVQR
jgi:hypothetical protein